MLPAAGALDAGGVLHGGGELGAHGHVHMGDDQQVGKKLAIHLGQEGVLGGNGQPDLGLQGLADLLLGAGGLQHAVDGGADLDDLVPLRHGGLVQGILGEGLVHLVEHHVAGVVTLAVGHGLPDLVAGKGQDGGHDLGHGIQDQPQGGLGAAALGAVLLVAVQPVLNDVQIEV